MQNVVNLEQGLPRLFHLNTYTLHITLYDLFFFGMIFIGLAFVLQLAFAKSINKSANRFLALSLVTMILWMMRILAIDVRLQTYLPHWDRLPMQFLLVTGPLIYFYVLKITRPQHKFRRKDLLHFTPLLLEQSVLVLEILENNRTGAPTYATSTFHLLNPVLQLLIFISIITYLYHSYQLIQNFYQRLQPILMDRSLLEFRWLRRLLVTTALLWLLWIAYAGVDYFGFASQLGVQGYYPFYILFAVIIIWTATAAFLKPQAGILAQQQPPRKPSPPAELRQKGAWLKREMAENHYYHDPELSLSSLAERLGLHTHELSRIINTTLKKSFNDFINEYRVSDVIRKMQDAAYDHITLLGIAYESGFNSQTSFNRIFKQMTGKSPLDYKNKLKKVQPSYNLGSRAQFMPVISSQQINSSWSENKLNRVNMFKNYIKIAWRNLSCHKANSFINISGLAIGMAACVVILLFALYEKSFDSMHHKNIYRLNNIETFTATATTQKTAVTMFPMGPTLKDEFPEVINYARLGGKNQYEMTYGEKRVFFKQTFFADGSFLNMFDFPLLQGDRQTALQKPNSIVLTESAARKLFGDANPVGKTITHFGEDTVLYTVTGILKDIPGNSEFQFDALQSFNTIYKPGWMDHWNNHWVSTYIELAQNTDVAALEKKFPAYLKKHVQGKDIHYGLFLLPLRDVHANATDIIYDDINFQKFDRRYTYIFMGIGLLVLFIACINFINLSTARSAERGKEVGIRKTIGASRRQLGVQFLTETVLLSLVALVIALGLVALALPYIDKLSGRNLVLFEHPGLLAELFAGTILLGVLSGLYPAVYLSAFRPTQVLKGAGGPGSNKSIFRNILVVGQFASAIFLTVATILVFRQLNYMEQQDPGFDRQQIVTLHLHGITSGKYALLKEELSGNSLVAGVTGAQDQLGSDIGAMGFGFWPGNGPMRVVFTPGLFVDHDYLSLYKIQLVAGRNFSNKKSALAKEFIINETLAAELLKGHEKMPLSWLIGKHFGGDTLSSIVGISKDFNFNSLHYKIQPMFLGDLNQLSGGGFSTMSVKINGRQAGKSLAFIGSAWKKVLPEYPFEYQFLDDHFKELYKTDTQVSRMVAIMTGLAILISCLGLYGLASFSTEKRTKEIGIRKIMGASVKDVVFLLSKHFIGLVLLGNLIAWPLAWLALRRWIQGYAYRVDISWWVFVLAGITALLIALATVSLLTIKAATSNPVKSLRTE